jgi:hypothetical protein
MCHVAGVVQHVVTIGCSARRTRRDTPSVRMMSSGSFVSSVKCPMSNGSRCEMISGTCALKIASRLACTEAVAIRFDPASDGTISSGVSPMIARMKPSTIACAPRVPLPRAILRVNSDGLNSAPNSPLRMGATNAAITGRKGSSSLCMPSPARSAVSSMRSQIMAFAAPFVSRFAIDSPRARPPIDKSSPMPAAMSAPTRLKSSSCSAAVSSAIWVTLGAGEGGQQNG